MSSRHAVAPPDLARAARSMISLGMDVHKDSITNRRGALVARVARENDVDVVGFGPVSV